MDWLESENDEPMLVQRIHKNRTIGAFYNAANIENMWKVPLRPDEDVLLCSYPKSGCHWVWDNIRMLLAGHVMADTVEKEQLMLELYDDPEDLAKFPSPRILNNHAHFDEQPAGLLGGKTKLVLVYRNPKDLCVSYYYHNIKIHFSNYKGTFKNFLLRFLQGRVPGGSCFDYWRMWERGLKENPQIPYLLVRYEDLHQNPISERRRLASFLGCTRDENFLRNVAESTCIDTMRKMKEDVSLKGDDGSAVIYRKGEVGDWQSHMTHRENEMFDQVVGKEMGDSKLFDFVYALT